ncbi:BlaI/MecI/CopY family transcriptional regulator [Riemerella columbina]|uniref:BlaI/MecI/CopY family transcriptional regulator n=1 Tax=Riemerella columbina TaxID=103810 RepID=UPI00266F589E|nr:BlaI/MecI/CopY family transcriptional regulator [Riemerella columbina]WKS95816.1 BlaI/MecI/CopY family transcriptional regulator [Riemerella columbina]
MKKVKQLTKAEDQVMRYLWKIKKGFLKDILELYDEPKPHSNTVSTILKVLTEKGFVDYEVYGRQHEYYPLISQKDYSERTFSGLIQNYFGGSYKDAVSFLIEENKMSIQDLELLLNELKNN